MPRGLWRWVENEGVAERWQARIEVRRGEWRDLDQVAYTRANIHPAFWDLPLQIDYLQAIRWGEAEARAHGWRDRIARLAVFAAVVMGCAFIAVVLGVAALLALARS